MKIVVSTDPIKFPLTGIGRYTYELVRHFQSNQDIEELKYFQHNQFVDEIAEKNQIRATDDRNVGAVQTLKRFVAKSKFAVSLYQHLKGRIPQDALEGHEDFIFHGTNFYLPKRHKRSVVTIHDISVFSMPTLHPKERVNYLQKEMQNSFERAKKIITDSQYVKSELIEKFGIDEDKIGVAYLACDDAFKPRRDEEIASALKKYQLQPKKFTLYAGTIEPRKNLSNLLAAYERLPNSIRREFPLVLAGYKGWNNGAIMRAIAQGEHQGWVKYLGFVPDEDLPLLYSGAQLFVFPSLYEGFGLPVLEAMSSGTPVVTSNRSSLPEVGGDAIAYVDPDDVKDIGEKIERGIVDAEWRNNAVTLGINQAQKFNWTRCANETIEIYQTVV